MIPAERETPPRLRPRLSVPRRGHVLSSTAERYGAPIRTAVAAVAAALRHPASPADIAASTWTAGPSSVAFARTAVEMTAWHLCTQWVLGTTLGALSDTATLTDAAAWFAPEDPNSLAAIAAEMGPRAHGSALAQLRSVADPEALADLMPYVLDPHGPGSRLSVRRDPKTQATRETKRSSGSFYTPADVADHMAQRSFRHAPLSHPLTVFDPACGTGVFLRAALTALCTSHPTANPLTLAEQSLFGVDVDPWAVDASAYVLLHDILAKRQRTRRTPRAIWSLLRGNLALADALSIDPARASGACSAVASNGQGCLPLSKQGKIPAAAQERRVAIDALFPTMLRGPHIIIGNPPYAPIGSRPDLAELGAIFETLRPIAPTSDIHPLFLEQMVRLAAPDTSGALVLPLSIAFNSRPQFTAGRRIIGRTAGAWRFSFFDREPHALFGEDVKTRNTIVSWSRRAGDARTQIMTGQLLKWRGDSRAQLLETIHFTEIEAAIDDGIPKLSGSLQSEAFAMLHAKRPRLADDMLSIAGSELTETFQADASTVFVGGTAYNFINAFLRPPAAMQPAGRPSANTVHAIRCASEADAAVIYAILSSRLTFWLWHVIGDGFHVSRAFLENLPIGLASIAKADRARLAKLGIQLWAQLKTAPLVSNNRGRTSIAFPAARAREQQQQIDAMLVGALGLKESFIDNLDAFTNSVVAAAPCGSIETLTPKECS